MIYRPYYTTGNRKLGFSLIEVIVSVSLFAVMILSATSIFKMVIDSQRSALATQNVQESLKFFLEVTAKEIRMAKKNGGACPGLGADDIYFVGTENGHDTLLFRNYYGECIKYSLSPDSGVTRFKVNRDSNYGFISPLKINIDHLDFVFSSSAAAQPMVTMNIQAHAVGVNLDQSKMTLQTSITSRYYK